jgi:hypothetical protein
MNKQDKFNFFAPAYLIKSGSGVGASVKVGGVLSTDKEDADGETLLTKGLDFSYFDGGWGKIKYEHDSPTSKEPDNIIGFPSRLIKSGRQASFEGELIPFDGLPNEQLTEQQKCAKSAYGLLKAIENYNRLHPNKPQKVGWSIEGEYLERDKKTGVVSKARITNVVLTVKPKNTETYATFVKSLQEGYGTAPDDETGFGATRLRSQGGTIKNKITQGDSNMFKSKEEAKKAFLSQGCSEEEAEKKATEWEHNQMDKSIQAQGSFKKAIASAQEVPAVEANIDPIKISQSLQKSVNSMKDANGNTDLTAYFNAKQEADISLLEVVSAVAEKTDKLAKSVEAIAQGLCDMAGDNSNFKKSVAIIGEATKINGQLLVKSLQGTAGVNFAPSDLLNKVQYHENSPKTANLDIDLSKMNKSIVANALDALKEEGKISGNDVGAYEGMNYIDESIVPMVKAKINSMQK